MVGHQKYQANQVEGAGPLGLILLTYEALYKSLAQARAAIQASDFQAETGHTSRALEAIIELSSSLNHEQGGNVALNLSHLYTYMARTLGEGLCTNSTQAVDEAIVLTQKLREGWLELEHSQKREQNLHNTSYQQPTSNMRAYATG